MDLELLPEVELVRQSQAGSLAAFEQLVYRYEHRIYGFVFQSCHNHADARELTQETFVRAFQALAQFDPRHAFASWLFTIARRKCIDHYRAAPPPTEETASEPEDHDDPAELLARREDREELWHTARRRLTSTQFQALWLRYVEDLDVARIAQVLRKTCTHVKVLLFRARQSLADELQTSGQGRGAAAPSGLAEETKRKETHEVMVCKVQDF
jgi:RNA polymerase sigma-70 factor (ECF subfamily)